jgi:hypothetical protein
VSTEWHRPRAAGCKCGVRRAHFFIIGITASYSEENPRDNKPYNLNSFHNNSSWEENCFCLRQKEISSWDRKYAFEDSSREVGKTPTSENENIFVSFLRKEDVKGR